MRPLLALALLPLSLAAQTRDGSGSSTQRMEIILERQEAGAWKVIDPGLVLASGERVRFRFRANFAGFLYVMNYGSSGKYDLLFPREETGRQNRIEAGQEYRIPATESWFKIGGPPGFDIVYWLASPVTLGSDGMGLPAPPKDKQPPKILLPRCDDSIFRARGLCIDSSAGVRGIPQAEELPENLKGVPGARSRELVIVRKDEAFVVSSPVPLSGPVLYEFRLAHK
ncbi:MAG: DUF4384 domain-containing protein [Bryobacterales bacterium]|nr:DUF4384 domain-containing protein [Bryobacterales bacterium]